MSIDERIEKADDALANYRFGPDFRCSEVDCWDTSDPCDLTCVVYLESRSAPEADSFASFHVRFDANGDVREVYALDMDSGGMLGNPASRQGFWLTRLVVDVLAEGSPVEWESLDDVHHAISEGDCCGRIAHEEVDLVSAGRAAGLLLEFGSEPGFFGLDDVTPRTSNSETGSESGALCDRYGGTWGEHPDHPVSDWTQEVHNDDTRLGYWAWVENRIEE